MLCSRFRLRFPLPRWRRLRLVDAGTARLASQTGVSCREHLRAAGHGELRRLRRIPAGNQFSDRVGTGRRRIWQALRLHASPGPASTALWLSAWTPLCTRTRVTIDRSARVSGAGRHMRCAEPSSRAPTQAARHYPPGVSAARMARRFFPTCGIRPVSIPRRAGIHGWLSGARVRPGQPIWERSSGRI